MTHRRAVQIDTIDDYCERAGIDHIDILKSDTQGYDLEVLRSAGKMLSAGKIKLVYLESSLTICIRDLRSSMRVTGFYRPWNDYRQFLRYALPAGSSILDRCTLQNWVRHNAGQ